MGSKAEHIRRKEFFDRPDPLSKHSLNQKVMRVKDKKEKNFYPEDKGARAERRKKEQLGVVPSLVAPKTNVLGAEETREDTLDSK